MHYEAPQQEADQLEVVGDTGCGRPGVRVELAVDGAEMHVDGQGAQAEPGRHLGRAQALRPQPQRLCSRRVKAPTRLLALDPSRWAGEQGALT